MLITQTPLRISLAGGGTDLPRFAEDFEGEVVGFAIDKYLFVWIKERFDRKIIVNYTQKEIVAKISEIQHDLVREAALMAGLKEGFDVITSADIPSQGSGLGSSSALTVGLINAFFQYCGEQLPTRDLAARACKVEIDVLKHPIGRQDQYLSALGGLRHLKFGPDGRVDAVPMNICPETLRLLNQNLILFYTGATRKASDILVSQVKMMPDALPLYHQLKATVRHVHEALEAGRVDDIGPIIHEGWEIKKKLGQGISLPEIDRMYSEARAAGATGGKLCGAGGGGFLLLYCPLSKQEEVRKRLKAYAEMPFQIEVDGTKAIFNARRPMWKTLA